MRKFGAIVDKSGEIGGTREEGLLQARLVGPLLRAWLICRRMRVCGCGGRANREGQRERRDGLRMAKGEHVIALCPSEE